MKEKPHVNIGTIGHVNHNKHTLTEAIKIALALENNKEKKEEHSYNLNIITVNDGDFDMIKGIKNYIGSTILGYKFVLDKNTSKRNKYAKENSKIKKGTLHNKVKVLNKRRDYSK